MLSVIVAAFKLFVLVADFIFNSIIYIVRWNTTNKETLVHAAWQYLENDNCILNLNYQDILNLILRINNYMLSIVLIHKA